MSVFLSNKSKNLPPLSVSPDFPFFLLEAISKEEIIKLFSSSFGENQLNELFEYLEKVVYPEFRYITETDIEIKAPLLVKAISILKKDGETSIVDFFKKNRKFGIQLCYLSFLNTHKNLVNRLPESAANAVRDYVSLKTKADLLDWITLFPEEEINKVVMSKVFGDTPIEPIYQKGNNIVYELTNYVAARKIGANTEWCVSSPTSGREHFYEYKSRKFNLYALIIGSSYYDEEATKYILAIKKRRETPPERITWEDFVDIYELDIFELMDNIWETVEHRLAYYFYSPLGDMSLTKLDKMVENIYDITKDEFSEILVQFYKKLIFQTDFFRNEFFNSTIDLTKQILKEKLKKIFEEFVMEYLNVSQEDAKKYLKHLIKLFATNIEGLVESYFSEEYDEFRYRNESIDLNTEVYDITQWEFELADWEDNHLEDKDEAEDILYEFSFANNELSDFYDDYLYCKKLIDRGKLLNDKFEKNFDNTQLHNEEKKKELIEEYTNSFRWPIKRVERMFHSEEGKYPIFDLIMKNNISVIFSLENLNDADKNEVKKYLTELFTSFNAWKVHPNLKGFIEQIKRTSIPTSYSSILILAAEVLEELI